MSILQAAQISNLRRTIWDRVKTFDEELPDQFEVVAIIGNSKFVLNEILTISNEFFIFKGETCDHKLPVEVICKPFDLPLTLTAQPRQAIQATKRLPVGFRTVQ